MCSEIMALGLDADLLFMDDASPDGTGEVLDGLARKHARVSVIHRERKAGIGSAHLDGITYAYERGYQRLVTLDCDFTHSPALIPTFLAAGDTAAVVVGSRYMRANSLPGWSLMRKALTRVGHILTETMLGMSEDATGAFRVYNLEAIPRSLFARVRSRGYAFFFESLLILNRSSFSIAEVPITLPARSAGHSKMSLGEIRRSLVTLGSLFIATRTDPDRFEFRNENSR